MLAHSFKSAMVIKGSDARGRCRELTHAAAHAIVLVRLHEEIARTVATDRLIYDDFLQVRGQARCVQEARDRHQGIANHALFVLSDKQHIRFLFAMAQHIIKGDTELVAPNGLAT